MKQHLEDPPLGIKYIHLPHDQFVRLRAIQNYDMWFVAERLERKKSVPHDRIDVAISEFKKYIALIVLGSKGIAMISKEVDEVWHNFILFTHEYANFCQEVVGEFVHHVPRTSRDRTILEPGEKFLNAYQRIFGEAPQIWSVEKEDAAKGNVYEVTGKGRKSDPEKAHSFMANAGDCDSGGCGYYVAARVHQEVPVWLFGADCQESDAEPPLPPDSSCQSNPKPDDSSENGKDKRETQGQDQSSNKSLV
jgi:hypothetical protein